MLTMLWFLLGNGCQRTLELGGGVSTRYGSCTGDKTVN